MNNKSYVHSVPNSFISVRKLRNWCSSIQLLWFLLLLTLLGDDPAQSFLGSLPSKPSVFVTVFAVRVAVGKT